LAEDTVAKLTGSGPPTREIGVAGISIQGGQILEPVPALRELSGLRGRRLFAEMAEEDATVGVCVAAIVLVILGVKWRVDPADDSPAAADEAAFVEGVLFEDMSHTWPDALHDIMTMVVYGFAALEIVYKRRVGPLEADPTRRSKFDDGRIGVRKLAGRHPLTVYGWETDDAGGVQALIQQPPTGTLITIPIERLLLFRTSRNFGNPEGKSLLVSSRRPWAEKKHIGSLEVTGIDRDLTGTPKLTAPAEVLAAATPEDAARLAAAKQLVENIKAGRQTGVILSSEPYRDADGKPTGAPLWDFSTIGTPGNRPVDIDKAQSRRTSEIMTAFFTQFLLLGGGSRKGGNRALSEDQSDFFVQSVAVAAERREGDGEPATCVPRLWALNGHRPGADAGASSTTRWRRTTSPSIGAIAARLTSMPAAGAPVGGRRGGGQLPAARGSGCRRRQIEDPRAGA
jgi:hypothetical protein